jgi:hypothetical protein
MAARKAVIFFAALPDDCLRRKRKRAEPPGKPLWHPYGTALIQQ